MITVIAYNHIQEVNVIRSFGDRRTEALFQGWSNRETVRLPIEVVKATLRKLDMLEAAVRLQDLRSHPGNRLEVLKGDLAGHYSIRVNERWRLVFRWEQEAAWDVTFMDYHE